MPSERDLGQEPSPQTAAQITLVGGLFDKTMLAQAAELRLHLPEPLAAEVRRRFADRGGRLADPRRTMCAFSTF